MSCCFGYMPWHPFGWGMNFLWVSTIIWIVFLGLMLTVVYVVIKLIVKKDTGRKVRRNALEILGQRYARGEISRHQYLEMKNDLALNERFRKTTSFDRGET